MEGHVMTLAGRLGVPFLRLDRFRPASQVLHDSKLNDLERNSEQQSDIVYIKNVLHVV